MPIPAEAVLLAGSIAPPDLADAFALRVPPGLSTDPQEWVDAIFRNPPAAVVALLRLRNALVGLVGIEPGDPSAFGAMARSEDEVLLGTDEEHLDFRGSVLVQPDRYGITITVSTVAAVRSTAGRGYLAVVRLVHPAVVKAMLRWAGRAAVAAAAGRPETGGTSLPLVASKGA